MYRFDDILTALKANRAIVIEEPIPACPKHADTNCSRIAGNCSIGNAQKCEQRLLFYVNDTKLFILCPKFVVSKDTKIGFLKESNITLNMLFSNGIIEKPKTIV